MTPSVSKRGFNILKKKQDLVKSTPVHTVSNNWILRSKHL